MMRMFSMMLFGTASIAMVVLWTGCSCDPVYPPEAGDDCSVEGDRTCDLDRESDLSLNLLICAETFEWVVETRCDDFGMVCREPDDEPMCVERTCIMGQTRCTPDYRQIIICNAAGEWVPSETCGEERVCVVDDGAAACVGDTCEEGSTRCSADAKQVETCDAEGEWVATEVCRAGEVCELRIAVATCVEAEITCSAATELDQRCNPDDPVWIQECRDVATAGEPIYEWEDIVDCSTMTPDYICQEEGDNLPFCFPPP